MKTAEEDFYAEIVAILPAHNLLMSPEIAEYFRQGFEKRDKGRISELRAFDILSGLPEVAKVDPTPTGGFYDADVFFTPDVPFYQVKLEIKSSAKGAAGLLDKVKDSHKDKGFSDVQVISWLKENYYVILVVGLDRSSSEIKANFYAQMDILARHHFGRDFRSVTSFPQPQLSWFPADG